MRKLPSIIILTIILSITVSCSREFLDVKPDNTLVVPSSIQDYQAMMNNSSIMNSGSIYELGIAASTEFYVTDAAWDLLGSRPNQRNAYIWAKDVYEGQTLEEWNRAYRRILYCNIVLDNVDDLPVGPEEQLQWESLKGMALFYRGTTFYQLAQLFCDAYDASSSNAGPGIPLRLEADVNMVSVRATIKETYSRIVADLTAAANLLPEKISNKQQPSRSAALAMLAKTFLLMQDYAQAEKYASFYLAANPELNDLNEMDLDARYTFPSDPELNPELTYRQTIINIAISALSRINVDTTLMKRYGPDDLRSKAYFYNNTDGRILFKGSYGGSSVLHTFPATDEIYLLRAECYARLKQPGRSMDDLNFLLKHRIDRTTFVPLTAANEQEALQLAIEHRKKELILRGVCWEDLRRLNREPQFAVTLERVLHGERFTLPPGDVRYTWPFPDDVIKTSGMQQNPR